MSTLAPTRSSAAPVAIARPTHTGALTVDQVLMALIVIGSFLVRIWNVGGRPMHLDESTVAWFAWQLLTGHGYAYDPVYHGPFQHQLLALVFLLFQSSETAARLPAVFLGVGIVILPWFIRDYLGRTATLVSAFLLAISPSFLYFARFERDDTYMEFFTFLLVVLVLRFLRDHRRSQFYGAALACALAFATKESIYIVLFIFGSFLVLLALGTRRRPTIPLETARASLLRPVVLAGFALALAAALALTVATGFYLPVPLVLAALLVTVVVMAARRGGTRPGPRPYAGLNGAAWINAVTLVVGIEILMYSTLGTNLNGLWDQAHPLLDTAHTCAYSLPLSLDPCRKDILGGLLYWLSQHHVARGGQPWYYYLLIYGLYEQLAVLLALVAVGRTLISRTLSPATRLFRVFLTYWAILALGIYSWAGEKFPWLGIHPLLPLTLLAGLGVADILTAQRRSIRIPALTAGLLLLALELHNSYLVNYVNGANTVEMMVYGQTPRDPLVDAQLIRNLSLRATDGPTLPVTIDSQDDWPFAWYLRNMPNVAYPGKSPGSGVPQAARPPYVSNPIVILDSTDAGYAPHSLTAGYARESRTLISWFPEDYKTWSWSQFLHATMQPNSWNAIWRWELFRTPFGPNETGSYYLYVKKGYFPAL